MTPLEIVERLFRQIALASAFVCFAWAAMDKFVPGFVAPFVNLPFFALVVLFLLVLGVLLPRIHATSNVIVNALVVIIAGLLGCYVYAKVDVGTPGLLLAIAVGSASLVLFRKISDPGSSPG
ncbi:MAG: hypothetical protein RDU25_03605 [Patescibacteria group bacterium]|nr:hypothetical protein [Patescibacteria group bacterium]